MSESYHIIPVQYSENKYTKTRATYQYDYGQILEFEGFDLPFAFEVHFSVGGGNTVTMIGENNQVVVPDVCLQTWGTVNIWLFLHDTESDGETRYAIDIPVMARAAITNEEPTPVQQDTITQAIAALSAGVTAAETAQEAAEAAADRAEQSATDAEGAAQTAAEDAVEAAEQALAEYKQAAESAATRAENSATDANSSRAAADVSATNAGVSERNASLSATAAAGSATAAAGSATTAGQKATQASNYADDAATSAGAAQTAAGTATTKAGEASQSASTASQKAQEAASSAGEASQSATDAETAKTAAETAKTNAESAATAAAGSASTAQTQAGNAATSATAAAGSATAAAGSASNAAASAAAAAQTAAGIETAGAAQVQAVNAAGTTQVGNVNTAGSTQVAAVNAKGQEVLESIPQDYTDLVDEVSDLNSAITQKQNAPTVAGTAGQVLSLDSNLSPVWADSAPASDDSKADVIVSSASGAIASFPDGMAAPAKKLVVGVEPVQDLHGQDAPYPPGGGKNKWHLYDNGYYNSSGVFIASASSGCSDKIPATHGQTVAFGAIKRGTNTVTLRGYCFDENDSIVGSQIVGTNSLTTTIPEGAVSVAFWFAVSGYTNTITQEYCDSIGIQAEIASSLSSTFAPYSNLCPISGWEGVDVTRTGENLWDEQWESGTYLNTNGTKYPSNSKIRNKNPISVKPNTAYFWYVGSTSADEDRIWCYDAGMNFIRSFISTHQTSIALSFTTPDRCAYINFSCKNTTYNNDISINYPSTDTAYHPGHVQTIPITFPSEAGTVFGATLTVEEYGTGRLVVDRAKDSFLWSNMELRESLDGYVRKRTNISAQSASPYSTDQLSNVGVKSVDNTALNPHFYCLTNVVTAVLPDTTPNDMVVEFLYKLATPIEYTLTAQEVLTILHGQNNVWANTGDTSVTYRADTKLYIDNKLAELVAQIVNS